MGTRGTAPLVPIGESTEVGGWQFSKLCTIFLDEFEVVHETVHRFRFIHKL